MARRGDEPARSDRYAHPQPYALATPEQCGPKTSGSAEQRAPRDDERRADERSDEEERGHLLTFCQNRAEPFDRFRSDFDRPDGSEFGIVIGDLDRAVFENLDGRAPLVAAAHRLLMDQFRHLDPSFIR